jgi:hypothetical protein
LWLEPPLGKIVFFFFSSLFPKAQAIKGKSEKKKGKHFIKIIKEKGSLTQQVHTQCTSTDSTYDDYTPPAPPTPPPRRISSVMALAAVVNSSKSR